MSYAEKITAYEAKRVALEAGLNSVMEEADSKGETLNAEQDEQFKDLEEQIKAVDVQLERYRTLEKLSAKGAKPVLGRNSDEANTNRGNVIVVKAPEKLPPGIEFARILRVRGMKYLKNNGKEIPVGGETEAEIARNMYGEDSSAYGHFTKAAVPVGTTTNPTWAQPLVPIEVGLGDFLEFLRPKTIIGQFGTGNIPSLGSIGFRTPIITQTTGGAGYWVGEGLAKPETKFDFVKTSLSPLKVANIAVVTMELIRDSNPSAERIIRDQLVAALRERLDRDFIDPAKAAVANVSPASITNGVVAIVSSGTTADAIRNDIQALFDTFIAANNDPMDAVFIMSAKTANALTSIYNPLGQPEFPGVSVMGGTLAGLPVIVSQYVPTYAGTAPPPVGSGYIFLINASQILLADEGGFTVDMSQEATLTNDDAPANPAVATFSLWQNNCVGFRAERTINWIKARPSAVAVLSGVLY